MTHTATAAQLLTNDIVFAGHGYGEVPAIVVSAGRVASKAVVVLSVGGRERQLVMAADHMLERGPRAGEDISGLLDYDTARDAR